jgi:hypothetical protein
MDPIGDLAIGTPEGYLIDGRTVTMPVVVRDATSAAATFLVNTAVARHLIPDGLEVVELLPGRALFSIACIQYRDNDLGNYKEVSLAFFVRRRGEPRRTPWVGAAMDLVKSRLATWIWKLPVDQEFTCAAGRGIWGFPKTVERIGIAESKGRSSCRLVMGERHVLTMAMPGGGTRPLPDASMITYTDIDGRLHRTRFSSGASEVGIRVGGVQLLLGDHPIADNLRVLGLPRRALLGVWLGKMRGRFEAPEPT